MGVPKQQDAADVFLHLHNATRFGGFSCLACIHVLLRSNVTIIRFHVGEVKQAQLCCLCKAPNLLTRLAELADEAESIDGSTLYFEE